MEEDLLFSYCFWNTIFGPNIFKTQHFLTNFFHPEINLYTNISLPPTFSRYKFLDINFFMLNICWTKFGGELKVFQVFKNSIVHIDNLKGVLPLKGGVVHFIFRNLWGGWGVCSFWDHDWRKEAFDTLASKCFCPMKDHGWAWTLLRAALMSLEPLDMNLDV